MKNLGKIFFICLFIAAIGGGGYYLGTMKGRDHAALSATATQSDKKPKYWVSPMNPSYIRQEPGKDLMGMDLVPVYEDDDQDAPPGSVKIDPVTIQNIGVRTAIALKRPLSRKIRTVGLVALNEKSETQVQTKVSGWIEKLYVDFTGQSIEEDAMLAEIYSPELVSAQEEYLVALDAIKKIKTGAIRGGAASLLQSAREKLDYLDIPEHQIEELERERVVKKNLHIHAPNAGIVLKKHIKEGAHVKPGMPLYTIADLSNVWVYADIYEYELPWLKQGAEAVMTLSYYPGKSFKGKVTFIYPTLEAKSRTVKVRLEFENPDFDLKPDMYANVEITGFVSDAALAVPKEAVIRSGERNIIVVALGKGRFRSDEVTLGAASGDGYYQITGGLQEGARVVTSAQFLIDSESRLNEAIAKMIAPKEGSDMPDQGEMKDHGDMAGMGEMEGTDGMEGMKMDAGTEGGLP